MATDIILCLFLVGFALILSFKGRYALEKDILFSSLRTFVQLLAVGFVIEFVFGLDSIPLVLFLLVIMTMVGGMTARVRFHRIRGGFLIAWLSIAGGVFASITPVFLSGAMPVEPKTLIPLAGIVIGGCTKATSLAFERIFSEISNSRDSIEMSLALGANASQAAGTSVRNSVRAALIPTIDSLKILGLIHIPGAMTGLILAGTAPLTAVRIQIIIMYMLLFSIFLCCIITVHASSRKFFTEALQLRTSLLDDGS
jgi:putative ABC transport system permease protein